MCGWDLTKIRATRSTVMNGHEFNKCYQIARTWGDMMFVSVNPCSIQIVIFFLHSIYEKNYSFSLFLLKGDHGPHHAWATWALLSSCLPYSCSSPLEQLCVSFISSSSWLCSCCSHSYCSTKFAFLMFSKLAFLLFFHILVALSSSHSWCSPSSHSCCSSRSCSCCSSRSHSCCSKLVFLLLQAHILVAFLDCVLTVPSSSSCCFSQSCSCCSKLTFKCCSS